LFTRLFPHYKESFFSLSWTQKFISFFFLIDVNINSEVAARRSYIATRRLNLVIAWILESDVSFNFIQFLTSKCGDEKSCYFEPDGCSSSGTCDYLVTFEPCEKKDNVNFELSAKSDWVAIGFNDEGKMVNNAIF